MLGLPRGTVRVVAHDPAWSELFEQEKLWLQRILGARALDIQHIGSTAVPDLAAKPVLDIGITVHDLGVMKTMVGDMATLGYTYFGDQAQRGDHFFAAGPGDRETCFVHVLQAGDQAWRDYLCFRDHLIANHDDRDRYMRFKQRLAAQYHDERRAYTGAKAALIQEILARARRATIDGLRAGSLAR